MLDFVRFVVYNYSGKLAGTVFVVQFKGGSTARANRWINGENVVIG